MTPGLNCALNGLQSTQMLTNVLTVHLIMLWIVGNFAVPAGGEGKCSIPHLIDNTENFVNQSYNIGDKLRYKCQSGFKRKAGTSNLIKCVKSDDGTAKWSSTTLICISQQLATIATSTETSLTTLNFTEEPSTATTSQHLPTITTSTATDLTIPSFTEELSAATTSQHLPTITASTATNLTTLNFTEEPSAATTGQHLPTVTTSTATNLTTLNFTEEPSGATASQHLPTLATSTATNLTTFNFTEHPSTATTGVSVGVSIPLVIMLLFIAVMWYKSIFSCRSCTLSNDRRYSLRDGSYRRRRNYDNSDNTQQQLELTDSLIPEDVRTQHVSRTVLPSEETLTEEEITKL